MEAIVTGIVAAVDFAPIVVGVGGIGAAVCVVVVATKGVNMLIGAIRGRG